MFVVEIRNSQILTFYELYISYVGHYIKCCSFRIKRQFQIKKIEEGLCQEKIFKVSVLEFCIDIF